MRRGFRTKKEAEAALHEAERRVRSGRLIDAGRITFGDYLVARWLPAIAADTKLKPTSVAGYRSMSRHLVASLGAVRLDQLTGDQLTTLYGDLRAAGKSERTVRYVHVTAHRAFKDACRWRLVAYNAADDADAPAQSRPDPKAWNPEQVAAFLEVEQGDRWWPLWRLAATTGMRRGELAGLRWADVDLERAKLTVRRNLVVVDHQLVEGTPKNDRARRVSLDPATIETLRTWRRQQLEERLAFGPSWPEHDRIFCWAEGTTLHPNVITGTYRRIVDQAGLPPLPLHNLRHAWATNALDNGVDVKDVATRLGHSSTRITHDIYVAPLPERDARAAALVASSTTVRARSAELV